MKEGIDILIDKTNWKKYRFDEMVQNVSERVEPSQTNLNIYVGLEHIDPDTLHLSRHGYPSDVEGTKLRFYKGDIIFGRRRAYQRKTALATTDGICSAHAMVLRAKEEVVDSNFLPFLFHSKQFIDMAITISVGGLSPTINWKDISKQEFLLPPKDEQKRLAELLWAAEEMIEKEKKELEQVLIEMRCIMRHFFQGEKQFKSIKDFGNVFTGSTPSTKNDHYWNGEYPFLTPSEIVDTLQPLSTNRTVTEEGLNAGRRIQEGDVLVTCVGEIGRLALANQTCCANQQINIISPHNKDIDSLYLYYNILHHRNILVNNSTKSVVPILVKSTFEEILLPDFSIDKKKHFLSILLDAENSLQMIKKQIELSQQLKQEVINTVY